MKTIRFLALGLLLASHGSLHAAPPPVGKTQQLTSPDQVPEGLAKSDWSSIRAAYEAGQHAFQPVEGGWQARNPGQQWTTKFDGRGFLAQPKGADWQWGLELRSYGFGEQQTPIGGVPAVKAEGQRLSYQWDATVQEWWVNDKRGLEHGFTVKERPPGSPALDSQTSTLNFQLATRGTLKPVITADALGVEFRDAAGATVLNYTGLKVWDADGKVLTSRFETAGKNCVRLLVEERGARYPLTIDPIAQQAYFKASQVTADDYFGISVAVSGNTVVVGAMWEDSSTTGINSTPNEGASAAGAAYVFVRSGGTWSQQAYLKASQVTADDYFGESVAVSGDTVVVGAQMEDSSTSGINSTPNEARGEAGAAYVFVRSGTTWSQQAYLKASQVSVDDFFGGSVAVSGDTVVVGAGGEDSSTTGIYSTPNEGASAAGAAYVFVRSSGTWSQQAYLKASQVTAVDYFGGSVAVSGDTVVVGAQMEDSSTSGINSTPDEARGEAGAAYVFVRSGTTWSQQAYLKASQVSVEDRFGFSVAVSGDTVVVGAIWEDSSTTGVNSTPNEALGVNGDAGAAYVFVRSGSTWSQQAYLKASQVSEGDFFGTSVAVSGDTVVVGAQNEDSSTTGINSAPNEGAFGAGAAYVFVRSGGTWSQQAYLKASQVTAFDSFGCSVAVNGDTMVVGAQYEDSSTTGINSTPNEGASGAGAAYIFTGLGPASGPDIAVAQAGAMTDGVGSKDLGNVAVGGSSVPLTFTITNTGDASLTSLGVTKSGTYATDFIVSALSGTSIPVGAGTVTFSVTFTPTGTVSATRSAALHIASNDPDAENPFDINLTGTVLSSTQDGDGDGLNDLAEVQLSALGFNWQVGQTALVNTYYSSANTAGLYTPAQVQALNVGTPLIQRHPTTGVFTLTIGVEKSTDLNIFNPFPMTGPGTSAVINGQGKLEFQFTVPDNAAFFKVQAQ